MMYYTVEEPTPRQLQVLHLLANGLSQVEVADTLQITPRTVAAHIERAKCRLKARTLPQAVVLCLRYKHLT